MGFSSHPVVKEYVEELKQITAVRESVKERLIRTRELILKAPDPVSAKSFTNQAQDLEREISLLTTKGEAYIKKIDQLNGVR